ncbi:MAG: hypothetical protein ACP5G7_04765 [Anaerolineae bacterium]
MAASLSLPARLMVLGGLVGLLAILIERWPRLATLREWLWRAAMGLGILGCGLLPAMHDRGPLAQPVLTVAAIGWAAGAWASWRAGGVPGRGWMMLSTGAMLLASLEGLIAVPVVACGWWFATAELLWLWAIGVLAVEATSKRVSNSQRGLYLSAAMQGVAVLLAEVGARGAWGLGGASEPILVARIAALLTTLAGLVLLAKAENDLPRGWSRIILVTVLVMAVWGGVHAWILAAGSAPTLYLWQ